MSPLFNRMALAFVGAVIIVLILAYVF